jgi:pectinesterase
MRKSSAARFVAIVLSLGTVGCNGGGGGGTGTAGTGGSSAGGTGSGTGGTGTAGTGATAGTGTAGTAGPGGTGVAGTGGGIAGSGGATAGSGGATAGSGGATAGSGGATGGSGGATGGSGGAAGGGVPAPIPALTGTATRPQLASGTEHTILKYFEKGGSLLTGLTTDNWNPVAGVGDVSTFTANFTVAASGGTHTTVQAALDAAVAMGGTTRLYIKVNAGTYRETVCLKGSNPTPPPITLYGTDPATTIIVNSANAGKMYVDAATQPAWNPCAATNPPTAGNTYGTSGSATAAFYARDFQAKNLTFQNDFDEAGGTCSIQAVALMTQNDRQIYESVRVLGHQDTLYVKSGNTGQVARNYFKNCYVEGDTDFIFGRGTFVLDTCEIKSLSARRSGGYIVSPSTDFRNAYGLLIIDSMLTAEAGAAAGSVFLGRAWDEGNSSGYPTVDANQGYPNGQVVIRGSMLGAHIIGAAPWSAAATSARAYSSVAVGAIPGNRLWEFQNTGAGAAP